mmetsp:Transcript_25183/g.53611  ORF Transcript_25183/g.53611 Transcript_25183/m.53611 type:complete len:301 (+) Transcript_25183:1074-1976(+)
MAPFLRLRHARFRTPTNPHHRHGGGIRVDPNPLQKRAGQPARIFGKIRLGAQGGVQGHPSHHVPRGRVGFPGAENGAGPDAGGVRQSLGGRQRRLREREEGDREAPAARPRQAVPGRGAAPRLHARPAPARFHRPRGRLAPVRRRRRAGRREFRRQLVPDAVPGGRGRRREHETGRHRHAPNDVGRRSSVGQFQGVAQGDIRFQRRHRRPDDFRAALIFPVEGRARHRSAIPRREQGERGVRLLQVALVVRGEIRRGGPPDAAVPEPPHPDQVPSPEAGDREAGRVGREPVLLPGGRRRL